MPIHPDVIRTDLEVLRGPLALAHDEPVKRGVVGELVSFKTGAEKFKAKVIAALGTLVVIMLGGAGGAYYSLRQGWVDHGVAQERSAQAAAERQRHDQRIRVLEIMCVRRDFPDMTLPDLPDLLRDGGM